MNNKLLDNLNDSQRQAVTSTASVILTLAGAGSGKTTVLTRRIAYLHQEHRIGTSNMLALTFTRLAGKEMKERVMKLIGEDQGRKLFVNTFHAFAVMVLRDWGYKLGVEKNFTIYDQEDREAILRQIIEEFGNRTTLAKVKDRFEKCKDVNEEKVNYPEECRVQIEYGYRLKQNNAVDLDRLIDLVNRLWNLHPDVLAYYKQTYTHVFIDEFQDTNDEQMTMIELLHPNNIFFVGDDFQCWKWDSIVLTSAGPKKVIDLQIGDRVQSVVNGKSQFVELTNKSEVKYKNILKITTESGHSINVTPEHKCFATLPDMKDGSWYVYIMYRNDKGFRLGVTSGGMNGIISARTFSERPERLWFLYKYSNKADAFYCEDWLSLEFQVPTCPFFHNGRNLGLGQKEIDNLFNRYGQNGLKILRWLNLDFDYPHYVPLGTTRQNQSHNNVYIYLNQSRGRCMVSFEKLGARIRKMFSGKKAYIEAVDFAAKVQEEQNAYMVVERFCLEKREYLNVIPAAGILPSMSIPVINEDGRIVLEKVISVEKGDCSNVYHLEAAETGIIVADNIITHNSIYGWRGARVEFIIDLPKYQPNCEVIKLEDNYRSTHNIVKAANTLIVHNLNQTKKTLRAHKDGPEIEVFNAGSEPEEAGDVITRIKAFQVSGLPLNQIAILARTNDQIDRLKGFLDEIQIPAIRVSGKDDPLKKRDIQRLISWIDIICNPKDTINFKKVLNFPKPYATQLEIKEAEIKAIEKDSTLLEVFYELKDVSSINPGIKVFFELIESISKRIYDEQLTDASQYFKVLVEKLEMKSFYEDQGLDNRVKDMVRAYGYIWKWEQSKKALGEDSRVYAFLKWLRYRDIQEKLILETQEDAVKLMTVHASKGLEFNTVFVIGMNQGSFPSKRTVDLEEERRLFYVAITRAKERLIITRSRTISDWSGNAKEVNGSRFIEEALSA